MDRNVSWNGKLILIIRSLSARRAWIEIIDYIIDYATDASLSARRAWIEIASRRRVPRRPLSLSARRAWIEIQKLLKKY